jgi:hypothetical protein
VGAANSEYELVSASVSADKSSCMAAGLQSVCEHKSSSVALVYTVYVEIHI